MRLFLFALFTLASTLGWIDSVEAQKTNADAIVVVGALSSGNLIAREILTQYRDAHLEPPLLIHVPDQIPMIPEMIGTFRPDDFNIRLETSDPEQAKAQIEHQLSRMGRTLRAVIGPFEGSVLLANQLANLLKRHTIAVNPTRLAEGWRDKGKMMATLREDHGPKDPPLRTPLELVTHSPEEAVAWVKTQGLLAPGGGGKVVLKPVKSAGTVGVKFVSTLENVKTAAHALLTDPRLNIFGNINKEFTVQEYLDGPEFVVNIVTLKHQDKIYRVVTDVWTYVKRRAASGNDVYHYDVLVRPDQVPTGLINYVYRVMSRLEMNTGWGHAEVKLVKGEPVLVEIGMRPMGSGQPKLVQDALSHSQIDLGVFAFTDPQKFIEYAEQHPDYSVPADKDIAVFTLMAPQKHLWLKKDAEEIVRKTLKTAVQVRLASASAPLPVTSTLEDTPGDIWLSGTPEDVQADLQRLDLLEKSGGIYEKRLMRTLAYKMRTCLGYFL